jgi:hypothetical protein
MMRERNSVSLHGRFASALVGIGLMDYLLPFHGLHQTAEDPSLTASLCRSLELKLRSADGCGLLDC